ncbi:ester cyclase [Pseudophaeobacter profundi]|uniref:ester cyclase n=1 Tax=Pseudophaeobacter profundi TaxID=3034152 RepID=UPI00242EF4F1|nr:ester cyclase [Pseudophaeobacter profundi]
MTEANKATVRAFYEAINEQRFDDLAQYCHPDFVFYHQVDTPHPGVAGFRASEEKNFAAFDDWQMPIVELIAEGDQVASYMIFEGIHARDWAGIPASGRKLRFSLFMKLTLRDGLIVEKRSHFDRADIRQQLAG